MLLTVTRRVQAYGYVFGWFIGHCLMMSRSLTNWRWEEPLGASWLITGWILLSFFFFLQKSLMLSQPEAADNTSVSVSKRVNSSSIFGSRLSSLWVTMRFFYGLSRGCLIWWDNHETTWLCTKLFSWKAITFKESQSWYHCFYTRPNKWNGGGGQKAIPKTKKRRFTRKTAGLRGSVPSNYVFWCSLPVVDFFVKDWLIGLVQFNFSFFQNDDFEKLVLDDLFQII